MSSSMIPGRIYRMHQEGSLQYIEGYFLDNEYFLEHSDSPVGKVDNEGSFYFFKVNDQGKPEFPDGVGGSVEGLLLTRVDGSRFYMVDMT